MLTMTMFPLLFSSVLDLFVIRDRLLVLIPFPRLHYLFFFHRLKQSGKCFFFILYFYLFDIKIFFHMTDPSLLFNIYLNAKGCRVVISQWNEIKKQYVAKIQYFLLTFSKARLLQCIIINTLIYKLVSRTHFQKAFIRCAQSQNNQKFWEHENQRT